MKKLVSTAYSNTSLSIALFILRAGSGALMIPHGYDKLQHYSKYAGGFIDPFHIGATASLSLNIFAELFCSILLIAGIFTRLACIPLIISMAIALLIAHHGDLFDKGQLATLFLIIFIALLFTGPGKFSLDKMIGK